ncbi:DUF3846 domain-containing protein [Rhodococcus artemisiae]|uniref:DUF3846 domain-containing protein n=1 Tax=Rhodococcus artemisiae TaxID=714159 RepID=A0ABU7LKY0_9NOCA|nr:DUF3846 domain-containing protein [Rhodococcus artemisiae]MEE2062190.1 DUF3846 domain-containing protein [Rhodococcus artemisiae]
MANTVLGVRLDVDGTATMIDLEKTESGVDAALRAALDCRVFDVVRLGRGLDMWLDDEGLCVGEPVVNEVATRIAQFHGFTWQPYVGPVVFASVDDEGETRSLVGEQIAALLATAHVGGLAVLDASLDAVDETAGVDA